MAFAVTEVKAYGLDISEPVQKRALQIVELKVTGTNSDVSLDIHDFGGTFWGDAGSSDEGALAKKVLQDVSTRVDKIVSYSFPEIQVNKTIVHSGATLGANQAKFALGANKIVGATLNAAEGLTSYNIVYVWSLKDGHRAVRAGF